MQAQQVDHVARPYTLAGELRTDFDPTIIAEVLAKGAAYMRPRIQAEPAGAGRLRAYIESNLGFMRPGGRRAAAARGADGSWIFDRAVLDKGAARLPRDVDDRDHVVARA